MSRRRPLGRNRRVLSFPREIPLSSADVTKRSSADWVLEQRLVIFFVRRAIRGTVDGPVVRKVDVEGDVPAAGLEQVVRLAVAGSTAAIAQLLRTLAPEMSRVVRGVLGPYAAEGDDALQQSLIALIHALPAFRGECAVAGYACRIAFRTALALRHRARKSELALGALGVDGPDRDPTVDSPNLILEAARRTAAVRTLLDEIPVEQAEALALRTMLGWSLEEIAASSGVPLNTVRSRLRLAKEALRRKIEGDPALAEALGVGS
jgi:RNA polymerase sigma-70 factor (ECF subfamily)